MVPRPFSPAALSFCLRLRMHRRGAQRSCSKIAHVTPLPESLDIAWTA